MNNESKIREIVTRHLNPVHLEIVNDSHRHAGHGGDDGSGQTHFDLLIVSAAFEGMARLARHRFVYSILDEVFQTGLHALRLQTLIPSEYNQTER